MFVCLFYVLMIIAEVTICHYLDPSGEAGDEQQAADETRMDKSGELHVTDHQLESAFDRLDANNDHYITVAELVTAFKDFGKGVNEAQAAALIRKTKTIMCVTRCGFVRLSTSTAPLDSPTQRFSPLARQSVACRRYRRVVLDSLDIQWDLILIPFS